MNVCNETFVNVTMLTMSRDVWEVCVFVFFFPKQVARFYNNFDVDLKTYFEEKYSKYL